MKVKDVMEKNFTFLNVDDTLETALNTFVRFKVNSVPVFNNDGFAGIVSDSDIIKYFAPKKYLFIWKRDKPTPVEKLREFTVAKILRKPKTKLMPNQDLNSILIVVSKERNCIPVMDGGQLVGIVRSDGIIKYLLKELAKAQYKDENSTLDPKTIDTVMDKVLEMVEKEGVITAMKIAKKLGITVNTVERIGEAFQKRHLVKMNYSFLRGAELRRVDK